MMPLTMLIAALMAQPTNAVERGRSQPQRGTTIDSRRIGAMQTAQGPWLGAPSHSRRIKLKRHRQHMARTARK